MLAKIVSVILMVTSPSIAHAIEGHFTMRGVTINQYMMDEQNKGKLYYQLSVTERYNRVSKYNYLDSLKKETAPNVIRYGSGTLRVGEFSVDFDSAYHFKGNLHLASARLSYQDTSYFSPELIFHPTHQRMIAKRIYFKKTNESGRVINKIQSNFVFDIHF
ncbi:hypothetical protein ACPV50_12305 [Vibrio astriarenae]